MLLCLLGLCAVIILSSPSDRRDVNSLRSEGLLSSVKRLPSKVEDFAIGLTKKRFLNKLNQQNLSRRIALLVIFAVGEAFVVIMGGIDLSVGSIIAFSGVLSAHLMVDRGIGMYPTIFLVLGASVLIGVWHGVLIAGIGLPPFVATLGSMSIFRSLSLLITAVPIAVVEERFVFLGNGRIGGVFTPVVIALGVVVFTICFMHLTVYGRYIYAVGSNEDASRLSGVNVGMIKTLAYTVSAFLAGLAGILFAAYDRQGNPSSGVAYELDAIAACVIGGCSLAGGEGSVLGTVIGASILRVIVNGLGFIVKKDASLWEGLIVGGVVVMAVAFNILRQRKR